MQAGDLALSAIKPESGLIAYLSAYSESAALGGLVGRCLETTMQNEWWIVVVDSSRARFFEAERLPSSLHEVEDLIDPAGRLQEHETGSERPGRSFESVGGARHALTGRTTARQRSRAQFARRVADHVEEALAQGRFRRLGLVAPPAMLGELRQALSERCRSRCSLEVASDIGRFGRTQIERHLAHAVPAVRS